MESKPPQNPPKKQKFKPRAPPRPIPKAEVKTEKVEDVDATRATELMRQFQERSMKGRVKDEKKVHASQIAFGMGAASISLKSYGAPKGGSSIKRAGGPSSSDGAYPPVPRVNEYQEPWDYYSNYPVSLPLRRPYSGDPAILDEQEFGEAGENAAYDENATSPAAELGLLEENVEPTMFFLQLPSIMPMIKRSANADSQDDKETSKPKSTSGIGKSCRVDDLPAGYMGKMLVYKSGAVKLKLGDTLYDVSPGMGCTFAQDVVAMNTAEKRYCVVGEIEKRAVVTPDVKALTASIPKFDR